MENITESFRPSTRRWLLGSFSGWLSLALCLVGIGFVIIAVTWWRNFGTRYELSDQRLTIHRGIILKSTDEIELYRVKDVRVDYSVINQIVDIGQIAIVSSDSTTKGGSLQMDSIPEARRRREKIRELVDAARQRRGVRELDFGMA